MLLGGSGSSDSDLDNLNYKWIAPAGIILSSNSIAKPSFTAPEVTEDTPYTFTLVVNDGIPDSSPATVKVTVLNTINVGVSNLESPLFNIYPNPTTGIITLEFIRNTDNKAEVSVSTILGAEVFRKKLIDAAKFQIDLSNQVNGIYMLRIVSGNQQTIRKVVGAKK